MPARGIHHVDLAVADVDTSAAFYLDLLGALGWVESMRYQTYRGTEDAVYLEANGQMLGLRPADGGAHGYSDVGIEHLAFQVDSQDEVDDACTMPPILRAGTPCCAIRPCKRVCTPWRHGDRAWLSKWGF